MNDVRAWLMLGATLVFSVGAHFIAWLGLTLLPLLQTAPPPNQILSVELEEVAPEIEEIPEPEPPEPDEPEPVLPEPIVEREIRAEPRPVPDPVETPAPPAEDPPAAEEAIADFTGTTLTNDSGEAWASNVGSGAPIEGPVGQPNAAVTGRRRQGVAGGAVGGTGEGPPSDVPVSDLSRAPTLADTDCLRQLLAQNYPRAARELGIEGDAVVRIRIRSTGRAQLLAVVREDHDGFGDACRRTLREGGEFVPPLDRQGRAVDTITTFRCTFSIRF